MAPRPPNRGVALPPSFLCRACGHLKPAREFSKNQLDKWYSTKKQDYRNEVTPQNIGLMCSAHRNGEREIRCNGPCDRIKAVTCFSKNQRNDPDPWCIACTDWRINLDDSEISDPTQDSSHVHDEIDNTENNGGPTRASLPSVADYRYGGYDDDENYDDDDDDDGLGGDIDDEPSYDDKASDGRVSSHLGAITGLIDHPRGYHSSVADDETAMDDISTTAVGTASSVHSRGSLADHATPLPGRNLYHPLRLGSSTNVSTASTLAGNHPQHGYTAHGGTFDSRHQSAQTISPMSTNNITHGAAGRIGNPLPYRMPLSNGGAGTGALPHNSQSSQSRGSKDNATSKWFKGDNRKVFYKTNHYTDLSREGNEAPHDSDSSDEM